MSAESLPAGYVQDATDCDDTSAAIYPGAPEVCGDGIDQDCDGSDLTCPTSGTYYFDADNDGYGDPNNSLYASTQPTGYVLNNTDCNDNNASIHPNATEICGDGIDQNCDGTDVSCGGGGGTSTTYYRDADGDGYGDPANSVTDTSQPSGYVVDNTDCDDTDAAVHPGATDTPGDGIDQDCDGVDGGGGVIDDHGNDYTTATPATISVTTNGDLETGGDIDYFSFQAVAGTTYTIFTTLVTLDDSYLTLYGTDGVTQLDFSDDSGFGASSIISWTCQAAGTYYLKVDGYWTSSTGTYTLMIKVDDFGDDYTTAAALTLGVWIDGDLETGGDTDYFSFYATGGTTYTISMTLGTLDDSYLSMYGTTGTDYLLADDDSGFGLASLVSWSCPSTGTYYIKAEGLWSYSSGTYNLLVKVDDHGDYYPVATQLTLANYISGDIEAGGDIDYFSFYAAAGVTYKIETALATLDDSFIYLYDTDGYTEIAHDDDGGSGFASKIVWPCTTSGTYYVAVVGLYSFSAGTYTLVAGNDDHGDDYLSATLVSVGVTTGGDLETGGDVDYFSFSASAGITYTIETTLATLDDTIIYLYDTDGVTSITFDDDGGSGFASLITWSCVTSGTYYVKVTGYDSTSKGTYTIMVNYW